MKGKISLIAGAALAFGVGTASAEEPMSLTAAQMDGVTAGGGVLFESFISKVEVIQESILITKFADVEVFVDIEGHLATAEGTADSIGENTDTEVFAYTQTVWIPGDTVGLSQSAVKSISATTAAIPTP